MEGQIYQLEVQKLREAVLRHDVETIRQLADYAHVPLPGSGRTAFLLAIELRRFDIIKTFIEFVDINWFDWRDDAQLFHELKIALPKETALHVAAKRCDVEMAKFLLKHGADPNVLDAERRPPIYYAAVIDCKEVVKLLLKHGAVYKGPAESSDIEIVKMLLTHGARLPRENRRIVCKHPELIDLATHIDDDDVEQLITTCYYDDNKKVVYEKLRRTRSAKLLKHAAMYNDVELIIELLPSAGIDDVVSALLCYARSRQIVAMLLKRLLSYEPGEIKMMLRKYYYDDDKDYPPHEALVRMLFREAARCGNAVLLSYLLSFGPPPPEDLMCHVGSKVAQMLLDRGVPLIPDCLTHLLHIPYVRRSASPEALLIAALIKKTSDEDWETTKKIVSEALMRGADPNVVYKKPILCYAIENAPVEVVELLLRHGANTNVDCDGKTPLHIAAEKCRPDVADLLLRHNANLTFSKSGETPIEIACNAVRDVILSHI